MEIEVVPEPKEIISHQGELSASIGLEGSEPCFIISDTQTHGPAGLIAERFKARIVSAEQEEGVHIRLNIVRDLDFSRKLRADQRVEAYCLEVSKKGIDLSALTAEGLLRAAATLFQLTTLENDHAIVPYAVINDWPDFRYRCASDWLINVECNRWAYDWGDGREAFLKRIKRKLDFCFEYKINMVWFDGFGWNTERFPGYASLMKECTRYARRLGIKLVFAGYGGGYGTAYQQAEIYRCGYFGNVYRNRRPYPNGEEYDCCGMPAYGGKSRRYGTCLSNEQLKSAKLEEMKRFVTEVNPGFMYIHDIDAGLWLATGEAWKQRCGECRKRWPSDELFGVDGQAGAYASWFKQVRQELSALPSSGDYTPVRDLVLIFTSPLYTFYAEPGPKNLWALEMRYFDSLSRLIGPEHGIEFGLREQFYYAGNRKKIGNLRDMMEQNGNEHGIHVIAFGGGDNYINDDPTNISGAMAHFYDGAESVCLSNGGMHEEPVQMLNAEFLWNGSAGGHRENPKNETEAVAVWKKIIAGEHKPSEIFAIGGFFERLCCRLWGREAGQLMNRALQSRHNGQMPVSHVWWTITSMVIMLNDDKACSRMNWDKELERWADRRQATVSALEYARKAAAISDNEDIRWFVRCLDVGGQYAEAVKLLVLFKSGKDKTARVRLDGIINDLEEYLCKNFIIKRTDILGGDPGCWLDTLSEIRKLARAAD